MRSNQPAPPPNRTGGGAVAAVRMAEVVRRYGSGHAAVEALRGVSVSFNAGSFTAVMGASGSGKSTLLHCAAGLDRPTRGSVWWGGEEISGLPERKLAIRRRERIGFVFQGFNLLPGMTVGQNVGLPIRLAGSHPDRAAVDRALDEVGLAGRGRHRPSELSGGEQQRVAIARSLITDPDVTFADEPTGALDRASGLRVLDLLRDVVDRLGRTCVMVTHDPVAAAFADRLLVLADGHLVEDLDRPSQAAIGALLTPPVAR